MRDFNEAQAMLCLAALSYRGFHGVGVGELHVARMRQALARGFETLSPGSPRYEVVWGPVAYRTAFSTFDDAVVYVARRLNGPAQYVVAIRGTNPISAFDWIFGDFWSGWQVAWPYGSKAHDGAAKISLSTALGLSIIQHMRSAAPPSDAAADVWRQLASDPGRQLLDAATRHLAPLGDAMARRMRGAAAKVRAGLDAIGDAGERFVDPVIDRRLSSMAQAWRDDRRSEVVHAVFDALSTVGDEQSPNILRLLHGGVRLRGELATGPNLTAFLRAALEHAGGPVDVVITGHSKGGALAPTVALWLAETRGTQGVAPHEQWDPHQRSTVRCYAFAGPTAGNEAFAAHSNEIIGPQTHRIYNRLDLVPRAWVPKDLRAIKGLYVGVREIDLVNTLVEEVAGQIADLRYCQVGDHVTELPGTIDRTRSDFFDQVIHQHLEGYLRGLDLGGLVNTATFFSPLS